MKRRKMAASNKPPNSPPPSLCFHGITTSQPKTRIKIVKTMQRRSNTDAINDDHMNGNKKWAKPTKFLASKFGSIFCGVFGYKKSRKACFSGGENVKDCENITLKREEQPFADQEKKQRRHGDEERPQQTSMAKKLSFKKPLSSSVFINKKTAMKIVRGKLENAITSGTCANAKAIASYGDDCGSDSNGNMNIIIRRQRRPCSSLPRLLSEGLIIRKKLTIARITVRKGSIRIDGDGEEPEQEDGEREEIGDQELCKKRILMGEKCKPLSHSGTLHYDKNGILIPEILQDY